MMSKSIFRVRYNGGNILVKATVDELENLYAEDKIEEYTLAEIFDLKGEMLVDKIRKVSFKIQKYEQGGTNMINLAVFQLDMWRDEMGGWTQNNQWHIKNIVAKSDSEVDLIAALYDAGMLKTKDRRRLYIDDYYSSNGRYELCARKENEPLYGLELIQ